MPAGARGRKRCHVPADRRRSWLLDEYISLLYLYIVGRPPKNTESQLNNRLAVLRAERGLSRQQLAAAIAVNYQTIGYLERGDYSPSLELAFRLSEFFELPIESIFAREPFTPLSQQMLSEEARG